jgi:hypothetical protein
MIVYEYKTYGYYQPYEGLFDWVGNVFHSIGHGISSAFHKVTSIFHSSPTTTSSSTSGAIKVGNTIGGDAYSILEGSSGATLNVASGGGKFGDTSSLFSSLLGKPSKQATLSFSNNSVFNPKSWTSNIPPGTGGTTSTSTTGATLHISEPVFNPSNWIRGTNLALKQAQRQSGLGNILGGALKQFTTTALQTLVTAGQLKLQQSILKSMGLLPKQPKVVYQPIPVPAHQPAQKPTVVVVSQPQKPPQPQPQYKPQNQSQYKPQNQSQPSHHHAGMFGNIPKEYLYLGGLLLLALFLARD